MNLKLPWFLTGNSWQGEDSEDSMLPLDIDARIHDQAMSMREGGDALNSSPDSEGLPTGGCYNMDYPDSWHDECNRRLDSDEYYEAEVDASLRNLNHAWIERT